jgi:hypothetical protein
MYGRLIVTAACALLCWTAHLNADWMLLDDFNGSPGPIGSPTWYQTTPLDNFYVGDGRLLATGKAMALHQTFPAPGGDSRIRFEAYSGEPGVGTRDYAPQSLSAIVGAKNATNYYEIKLLSDNLLSTDFYRLHLSSVLGDVPTNDMTINLDTQIDAVRLDAFFNKTTVSVILQPFDRNTGMDIGTALTYSFSPVTAALADDPGAVHVGLAAQGKYVEVDNFEGFVAPEAATFISVLVLCLPLLRTRRRAR